MLLGFLWACREAKVPGRAGPNVITVLVDLRGHGRSTETPSDLSRLAFVADVVQVI